MPASSIAAVATEATAAHKIRSYNPGVLSTTSHLLLSLCVGKNRNAPPQRISVRRHGFVFLVHCNRVSAGASGNVLKPFFGHCIDQPNDEPRLRSSANTDCRPGSKESDAGDRARIRSLSDRNTASLNLEIGLKGVPVPLLSRYLLDDQSTCCPGVIVRGCEYGDAAG